jgi:hypothetical protein
MSFSKNPTLKPLPFTMLGLITLAIVATPTIARAQSSSAAAETATDFTDDSTDDSAEAKKKESEHFMRIRRDYRGRQIALETSITRYQVKNNQGEPISVDLIGVVHIGEKEYFEDLNQRFEAYDSLLYELVAPKGTRVPKGGGARGGVPTNPLAAMQKGMQSALGLEFQLEHIDYTKDNFIHADMSPEEFGKSMSSNDESIAGYGLKAIGQGIAMQSAGKSNDSLGMLMMAFSSNKQYRMRKMFAKQIKQMEAGMVVFSGKDGSTIITHRNGKCMEILTQQIAKGKKNIAIFYGAGHLPDMQRRLISDFKAKRAGQVWLEAWKLREPN